jgi:hypothetical protein
VLTTYGRMDFGPSNTKVVEGGTKVLTFHGTDVQWSPEFQELDSRFAPATLWEKRCYFLNTTRSPAPAAGPRHRQPQAPARV